MAMKLGSTTITGAMLGSTSVTAIYLGATEVWSAAPAVLDLSPGFDATFDHGTDGDVFLDADLGDDANGGTDIDTDAVKTLARAVALMGPGKTLRGRGVVRGFLNFADTFQTGFMSGTALAPTVFGRYGTDPFEITGAEPLTGLTVCGAGREALLGPNYGSVYEVTLANSAFPNGNIRAAFPFENGTRLPPAMLRRIAPLYPLSEWAEMDWLQADAVVEDATNVTGITHAATVARFTEAQILNAEINFIYANNVAERSAIASIDGNTLVLATPRAKSSGTNKLNFSLVNILPLLEPGTHGWLDNGDSTGTLFIRPVDPANIAANMSYSAREQAIDAAGSRHVHFKGVEVSRTAAADRDAWSKHHAISLVAGTVDQSGIVVENVRVRDTYRNRPASAPVLWNGLGTSPIIDRITVERAYGQSGLDIEGDETTGVFGGRVHRASIIAADKSAMKFYNQVDLLVSHSEARKCGVAAHANVVFPYQKPSKNIAFFACDFEGNLGYATDQIASEIAYGLVVLEAGLDGRAYWPQNSGLITTADAAGVDMVSLFLGVLALGNSTTPGYAQNVKIGDITHLHDIWRVKGTLAHGFLVGGAAIVDAWSDNGVTYGAGYDVSDTVYTYSAVFEEMEIGDTSIKATSPTRGVTVDLTAEIALLTARFPDFEHFNRDPAGRLFTASAAPFAAFVDPDEARPFDPFWRVQPDISFDGTTYTVSGGFLKGRPFPLITGVWVRSLHGWSTESDWEVIPGQSSQTYSPAGMTYTPAPGDNAGYFVGYRVTGGSAVTIAAMQDKVAVAAAAPAFVQRTGGADTGYKSAFSITLPSGITDGNTLVLELVSGQGTTRTMATPPAGWTLVGTFAGVDSNTFVYKKIASGDAGATVSFAFSGGTVLSWWVVEAANAAGNVVMAPISASLDPPSLTPAGGDIPRLWIASTTQTGVDRTATAGPAGYSNLLHVANPYAGLNMATKEASAATEDPGVFPYSGTPGTDSAVTVAVW